MPKKQNKLPVVLSPKELVHFFDCVHRYNHQVILTVCYAAGLRVSEATHLRPTAIDSRRMLIRVEQGKNHKDRFVMLSPKLLDTLRNFWWTTRPPGRYANLSYRRACLQWLW
jgi:integrase/recombinase XerD